MGNDEAIIYGDRHGEQYREDGTGKETVWRTFYPNAVRLSSIGGRDVSIGVVTFDQETGQREQFNPENPDAITSLYTSLDRAGVNRLIADLRKMRDRVFGKDE